MKKTGSWLTPYLLAGFVWGCSFVFIKGGLEFLTPFGVAFIRCALGAITLYAYARYKKIQLPRGKKIVITCTGNGLKDIPWALEGAADPVVVPVNADVAAQALGLVKN